MSFTALVAVACTLAVASAQWKVLTTNLEVFDTGIDFVSDTTGYTAGDAGTGPDVYITTDGQSFIRQHAHSRNASPLHFFLWSADLSQAAARGTR